MIPMKNTTAAMITAAVIVAVIIVIHYELWALFAIPVGASLAWRHEKQREKTIIDDATRDEEARLAVVRANDAVTDPLDIAPSDLAAELRGERQ